MPVKVLALPGATLRVKTLKVRGSPEGGEPSLALAL